MPFFKRAKKSDQVANPPLDGSNAPIPQAAANPEDDGAGEKNENAMALARTRTEDIVYPSGLKLALLMTSVFVSMFLVALVRQLMFFSLFVSFCIFSEDESDTPGLALRI